MGRIAHIRRLNPSRARHLEKQLVAALEYTLRKAESCENFAPAELDTRILSLGDVAQHV
jgi:hypothetical protein